MNRPRSNRVRIVAPLLAALGIVAVLALPGIAAAKDRNHDRIPDRWEKRHHLSLKVNQAAHDQDGDALDNRGEFQAGDDPRDRDSDDDGVMDGAENAGTITSYDAETGKLTITLFGGETVSGIVTGETLIRCGHEGDGEDESGEDSTATASDRGPDGSSEPGSTIPGKGDDGSGDVPGNDGPGTTTTTSEDPGNGDKSSANCGPEALVAGATVEEAELELEHGVATFEEIELAE